LDQTRFRQLMGVLGIGAEVFDRDLDTYSQGQLKKVDLCRSMLAGADILLWDEPLNYVDLMSREQVEASVLRDRPTLLFVEHDQLFVERIATRVIDLSPETDTQYPPESAQSTTTRPGGPHPRAPG
jgi:lincosamide and streptogramin A transport system ATP-binding/permease protein